MAEILLSPILEMLFQKLVSPTFKKLVRYMGIHSEVQKWETSLSEIRALLNDASQKEVTDEYIKGWLHRLQHLTYDINDVLDALATKAMHHELTEEAGSITSKVKKLIPTCCTSFSVSTRMHDKLSNITTKLQDLEKEKITLGLIVINGRPLIMNRNYETGLPDVGCIVGREGEKEALLYKLLGDETCNRPFNIVPIVGMGGMGKTTLARVLYNEPQVKEHFHLMAWVCVSNEFNILKISKSIFESMTGENKEFANLHLLQVTLKEQLVGKRFLLVLDDVWSVKDWETLVRPFDSGAPGSKIIMTTRKEKLLKNLGYNHLYHLQNLSYNDALLLFCQHALGVNNFDSHHTLGPYGEGIVKKCDGLPLALKALGRLLSTKTDEEEWKELLNSDLWRLQNDDGNDDGIVPALRLSYHDLGACLKQLFAYCSLFPKGYIFEKEELTILWMAEGFLDQSTTSKSTMESLGHEYFEELLSRSFFQRAPNEETLFVMHDLINDLAASVAGEFVWRFDNEMENDARKESLERYRHMSFVRDEFGTYNKFKTFKRAKNLRTFLAVSIGVKKSWGTFHLSSKILVDLLHELPLLRVLCLSYLEIDEVPQSIGSLKHLRYLNLSETRITCLPENVCNLYNLQTLIVFGCDRLSKLPKSFLKLKNLRHFDIGRTPLLNNMPLGIGELNNLQTLSKIIIGGDNGFSMTKLKNLKNLCGKISFEGLDRVQNASDAHEVNLSQKRLSELELEWSDIFDGSRKENVEKEVLNVLEPRNDNLKKLDIVSYGGIGFPNWVGDPSFLCLTHVSIYGCKMCTSLPPLGQLPSLKQLVIQGNDGVKVVDFQLLGTGIIFASLQNLSFIDMQGWEVWSTNSGAVDAIFPCLRELYIDDCPNLVEVSLTEIPSLKVLNVRHCSHGVLRSLVCVASSVTRLVVGSISGLTDRLWRGVIESIGTVEEVIIKNCNEIRNLWESEAEAFKVLVNLRKLIVDHCENLVSLGEKEEDDCRSNLTCLKMLAIWYCNNIEHCSCPNSIETLGIFSCSSLTSVSFPRGGHKLKSFFIKNCDNISEKELGGEGAEKTNMLINASMQMLEVIVLHSWSNLKSIIGLSSFVNLTRLMIEDCPSMESFPDHELSNLTALTEMSIENCPSMDASFPRGHWPPKLCFLRIGGLKKPISKWSPQDFPTSLVNLGLRGGSSEDVSNCGQLSHLLPLSLTSLSIEEFEKLESLSTGLQHLTSLQHLTVSMCPKINALPKKLLPSLLSLKIFECPNLDKRCSRRGSYHHLISDIPEIVI